MANYRRRCRRCRKWIQLRQMPAGQWVAFDGYDTVHECRPDTVKSHSSAMPPSRERQPAPFGSATPPSAPSTYQQPHQGGIPAIVWILVAIIILLVIFG
jgi:hypothetical protein